MTIALNRSTLIAMGYTHPALRTLLPPADEISCTFEGFGGRYYPRPEYGWPDRDAVAKALTSRPAREWRTKQNTKRAKLGLKPIPSLAQYLRAQETIRNRAEKLHTRNLAEKTRENAQTEKQLDLIRAMRPETILTLAPECMHAANRRAKHLSKFENREIYAVKNAYLQEIVALGQGKIYTYQITGEATYGECECLGCGNSWIGRSGSPCYECGDDGHVHGTQVDTWYVVQIGEHRFHQPGNTAPSSWRSIATPCEPHEPTQPKREVPKVRTRGRVLTPAATLAVVRRAVEILRGHAKNAEGKAA